MKGIGWLYGGCGGVMIRILCLVTGKRVVLDTGVFPAGHGGFNTPSPN